MDILSIIIMGIVIYAAVAFAIRNELGSLVNKPKEGPVNAPISKLNMIGVLSEAEIEVYKNEVRYMEEFEVDQREFDEYKEILDTLLRAEKISEEAYSTKKAILVKYYNIA